jgi:hypothetical protein
LKNSHIEPQPILPVLPLVPVEAAKVLEEVEEVLVPQRYETAGEQNWSVY